ncbi:hypothetical protein F4780DRAFT_770120 [Xylariomycetidae sp. FL0641]|nr:hypothetical protein F4780DRAFT_770120 [Xylariomycetidae sp. FL0641]
MYPSQSTGLALGLSAFTALANAAHHNVTVGKDNQLKFDPETLSAQIGDTITYSFFSKNHAVAQSTFDDPCHLQDDGIFSGFTPNTESDVAAPTTFTITVNDTEPLWFYCPQTTGDHCQNGMVHSINAPTEGNTFDAYKAKAQLASTPSTPSDDQIPTGGLRKLHIDVGFDSQLVFNPSNVTEIIGTVVEFEYNPMNHSIVQSSFDAPCQPLESGFAAPFVPTNQTSSGVTFEVTITNNDPVWFYCAQTMKSHCQSGMVGSINAATEGDKTFQAFKDLAAKAGPSTITDNTPLVGALKVNGTFVPDVGGVVLDVPPLDPSLVYEIPPPGESYAPYIGYMAGGQQPTDYGWASNITEQGTALLQDLFTISNVVVFGLLDGFSKLNGGAWAGTYPESIVSTLGSLAAQSLVQRKTLSDSLQHYEQIMPSVCQYNLGTADDIDTWLQTSVNLLNLLSGATLDAASQAAASDPWMVPALASAVGATARMAAVLNMMQGHVAAAAPRDPVLPLALARSFVASKYAVDGSCGHDAAQSTIYPGLVIANKTMTVAGGGVYQVEVEIPDDTAAPLYLAWLGAWGGVLYTDVAADGTSLVPEQLYGPAWMVLTKEKDLAARDIPGAAVAGPETMWTKQQWAA